MDNVVPWPEGYAIPCHCVTELSRNLAPFWAGIEPAESQLIAEAAEDLLVDIAETGLVPVFEVGAEAAMKAVPSK